MKDPAFLFYPSDFLTGVLFMNNEQVGIYIRLLCAQHQHGGLVDKDSFNSLVGTNQLLRNKFIETEAGFYNERLTHEMDIRNKKSNNMSEVAKEVWAKRKAKVIQLESKSNTKVKKNDTNVIHSINININENGNENGIENNKFIKPEISEILTYCQERGNSVDAEKFLNHYESNGWKVGKNKMKNWKAAVRSWETNEFNKKEKSELSLPEQMMAVNLKLRENE